MSNVKWSGIEQKKYGLTARWYVSAKYGYATDEGGWGLYNPVSNVDGWGGKKRPFNNIDEVLIQSSSGNIVIDSGKYQLSSLNQSRYLIGDGDVTIVDTIVAGSSCRFYHLNILSCAFDNSFPTLGFIDCICLYSLISSRIIGGYTNSIFAECSFGTGSSAGNFPIVNCSFIRCSGTLPTGSDILQNNYIESSPDLTLTTTSPRPIGRIFDYSIIIGSVKTTALINGKTTGVTIEDFKVDGRYFRKSYSEVDLFGNVEGSGASTAQLNEIFNNFYYPYIDDWQYLDLSLRPDVDDRVRYGGLNGHFIGALPVGYHFDIPTLWNTYKDAGNTTNVELNMMDRLIRTNPAIPGVYTSTTITLPNVIDETDVAMFFKNNVYDSNGVAVQRLDYSVDPAKDAALEQRTVYSYRMKTSPDDVTPLTDWKEYELDRAPTVDASGNSNIDDLFDSATETKQPIKRFIIEITLRSE